MDYAWSGLDDFIVQKLGINLYKRKADTFIVSYQREHCTEELLMGKGLLEGSLSTVSSAASKIDSESQKKCLSVCLCLCAHRGQGRMSEPPELEFRAAVSCLV